MARMHAHTPSGSMYHAPVPPICLGNSGALHTYNYAFHMHAGKNDRMTNKEKNS